MLPFSMKQTPPNIFCSVTARPLSATLILSSSEGFAISGSRTGAIVGVQADHGGQPACNMRCSGSPLPTPPRAVTTLGTGAIAAGRAGNGAALRLGRPDVRNRKPTTPPSARHHPRRASARRERRHRGAGDGEFRPDRPSPRQATRGLAERQGAGRREPRRSRHRCGQGVRQRRRGDRRPRLCRGDDRTAAGGYQDRPRAARGRPPPFRRRRRGQALRRPLRPGADRPLQRRALARRRDHHLSGRADLRLAQRRAGGSPSRLRMASCRDRRGTCPSTPRCPISRQRPT